MSTKEKEYQILKLMEYERFKKLTVPKFALEQLKDAKTFMCFIQDGVLCYRPMKEDDLKNLAKI